MLLLGDFTGPTTFDTACRAAGSLAPPDGMTHTAYFKKALEDELKVAGGHASGSPKVTLSGSVDKLSFSSSRGLTGGSWDIDVTLNLLLMEKTMKANEHYEFESGFVADTHANKPLKHICLCRSELDRKNRSFP